VLVVDDNVEAADALTLLLRARGHRVSVGYDSWTALRMAQAFRPDVVVLDVGLPRLHGLEVARRLRQDAAFRDAVLVAVTGSDGETHRLGAHEAGFDAVLCKPFDPDQLEQVLAKPRLAG